MTPSVSAGAGDVVEVVLPELFRREMLVECREDWTLGDDEAEYVELAKRAHHHLVVMKRVGTQHKGMMPRDVAEYLLRYARLLSNDENRLLAQDPTNEMPPRLPWSASRAIEHLERALRSE